MICAAQHVKPRCAAPTKWAQPANSPLHLQRACQLRVHLVLLAGQRKHHVQEVGAVAEVIARVHNGLPCTHCSQGVRDSGFTGIVRLNAPIDVLYATAASVDILLTILQSP